jgi:hypothetical protein
MSIILDFEASDLPLEAHMSRGQGNDDSFGGTAALVFVGFFALVIATSAAGRWLADLGPAPVAAPKAAAPAAPATPAPAPAPPAAVPQQPVPAPAP